MKVLGKYSLLIFFVSCASGLPRAPEANPFTAANAPIELDKFTAQSPQHEHVHILYSSNVNGELNPCGCAMNPKGGVDRRLNFVEAYQKKFPAVVLDAGNALFPAEKMDASQIEKMKS